MRIDPAKAFAPVAVVIFMLAALPTSPAAGAPLVLPLAVAPAPWDPNDPNAYPDVFAALDASTTTARPLQERPGARTMLDVKGLPAHRDSPGVHLLDPLGGIAASTVVALTTGEADAVLETSAIFFPVDMRSAGQWKILDADAVVLSTFSIVEPEAGEFYFLDVDSCSVSNPLCAFRYSSAGAPDHCTSLHWHVYEEYDSTDTASYGNPGSNAGTIYKRRVTYDGSIYDPCLGNHLWYDDKVWGAGWDFYGQTSVTSGLHLYTAAFGDKGERYYSNEGTYCRRRTWTMQYPQVAVDRINGLEVSEIVQASRDGASADEDNLIKQAAQVLASYLLGLMNIPDFTQLLYSSTYGTDLFYNNAVTGNPSTRLWFNYDDWEKSDGKGYTYGGKWEIQWASTGTHQVKAMGSVKEKVTVRTTYCANGALVSEITDTPSYAWDNAIATFYVTRTI